MNSIDNTEKEVEKKAAAERKAATEAKARANDPKRMVQIKLFKDNDRYKHPVYVSVNDYSALIQRGVTVSIPYYVAKHIEEMQAQDESTAALIQGLTDQYDTNKAFLE